MKIISVTFFLFFISLITCLSQNKPDQTIDKKVIRLEVPNINTNKQTNKMVEVNSAVNEDLKTSVQDIEIPAKKNNNESTKAKVTLVPVNESLLIKIE